MQSSYSLLYQLNASEVTDEAVAGLTVQRKLCTQYKKQQQQRSVTAKQQIIQFWQ
jgi:hypothetical protein